MNVAYLLYSTKNVILNTQLECRFAECLARTDLDTSRCTDLRINNSILPMRVLWRYKPADARV